MDWSDVLTAALAFFLVVTGLGLGYLLYRMAGLFMSLTRSVDLMTDETVPILSRAQITMDGVNQEIGRVDEIMISAVNATKGTEKAVTALSRGITAPVRKASGFVAGVKEAVATLRARSAAEAADRDYGRSEPPPPPPPPSAPLKTAPRPAPATTAPTEQAATSVSEAAAAAAAAATRPPPARGWTDQRAQRAAAAASSGAPPPPPAAPSPATDQGAGGWAEQRAKRAAAARGGGSAA